MSATDAPARRTKRRYAHELYPHPGEFEVRPLAVEVPYLYARAHGMRVDDTGWFDLFHSDEGKWVCTQRTLLLIASRSAALVADALLQGLTGDEAWEWAHSRMDEAGEWVWERAEHYGVPLDSIRPYPCGPEPDHHDHWTDRDARGTRTLIGRVDGPESACPECTEAVEETR